MLLERRSRIQARDRVESGRFRKLLWNGLPVYRLLRRCSSETAERPLAIDQPSVENENQAQRSPARLIGANLVKVICVAKKGMNRGEHKGHSRECGDQ